MDDLKNCMYCSKDKQLKELMIEVVKLKSSTVYLYKECSYPGRCVVAVNRHLEKMTELSDQERTDLSDEVAFVAKAITKLYKPDNINYLILGDLSLHLHVHIVPKYKNGLSWGSIFQMMPEQPENLPTEEDYLPMVSDLRQELQKQLS